MTTKETSLEEKKKILVIPPIIEKLPFCVKVVLQKIGPEDFRVLYQIDHEVILELMKQIEELKKIDLNISNLVDEAVIFLKKLKELPDSMEPESLDIIQNVKKKLDEMKLK